MGARRNLIIRGTRKIYDPTIAHVGMLLASRAGDAERIYLTFGSPNHRTAA